MSVIKACIERFRLQAPLPPEARDKFLTPEDFWWSSHLPDVSPSSSLATGIDQVSEVPPNEVVGDDSRELSQQLASEEASITSQDENHFSSVQLLIMLIPIPCRL